MSTRSFIGLKKKDGIEFIYCHHDGYVKNGVGEELVKNFSTPEKIEELIARGNTSSLAFGDEYGGKSERASSIESEQGFVKIGLESDTDYAYLFRDQEWYVSDVCSWHPGFRTFQLVKDLL